VAAPAMGHGEDCGASPLTSLPRSSFSISFHAFVPTYTLRARVTVSEMVVHPPAEYIYLAATLLESVSADGQSESDPASSCEGRKSIRVVRERQRGRADSPR